jgi:hypothetical protein
MINISTVSMFRDFGKQLVDAEVVENGDLFGATGSVRRARRACP